MIIVFNQQNFRYFASLETHKANSHHMLSENIKNYTNHKHCILSTCSSFAGHAQPWFCSGSLSSILKGFTLFQVGPILIHVCILNLRATKKKMNVGYYSWWLLKNMTFIVSAELQMDIWDGLCIDAYYYVLLLCIGWALWGLSSETIVCTDQYLVFWSTDCTASLPIPDFVGLARLFSFTCLRSSRDL